MRHAAGAALATAAFLAAATDIPAHSDSSASPTPPVAEARPHRFTRHGVTIEDPYAWLRDPDYPTVDDEDVLAYLRAENTWFDAVMAPVEGLVEDLFREIKAREKPDDASVPLRDGGWFYQWRFESGAQYRTWTRWPVDDPDAVETILDEPALAEGHDYFALGSMSVSHDGRLLAYSTDTSGGERYTMRVKDLRDGRILDERIEDTHGDAVWAADNRTFFYLVMNEHWRSHQVRRHVVGQAVETDGIVYTEPDSGFWVGLGRGVLEALRRHLHRRPGDERIPSGPVRSPGHRARPGCGTARGPRLRRRPPG